MYFQIVNRNLEFDYCHLNINELRIIPGLETALTKYINICNHESFVRLCDASEDAKNRHNKMVEQFGDWT